MRFKLKRVTEETQDVRVIGGEPAGLASETSHLERQSPDVPEPAQRETEALLASVMKWAGQDPKRWDSVLKSLKRTWSPEGCIPDTPRDLLVAWASASYQLAKARGELERLQSQKSLTKMARAAKGGREADVSFYGRLAQGLKSRAALALEADPEAADLIARLCNTHDEEVKQ